MRVGIGLLQPGNDLADSSSLGLVGFARHVTPPSGIAAPPRRTPREEGAARAPRDSQYHRNGPRHKLARSTLANRASPDARVAATGSAGSAAFAAGALCKVRAGYAASRG